MSQRDDQTRGPEGGGHVGSSNHAYALLIVGGGPAGLAAARAYRAADGGGRVAIITDEHLIPYARPPLTKDLLRRESSTADLPIEPEAWFDRNRVELIGGRAVGLDAGERTVTLSGGRVLEYGHCLLGTGAEPKRLPVPGADHPRVGVMRSLDDLRRLEDRLGDGTRVAVVGSGFIACEIAASLSSRGCAVEMVSDEDAPNVARLGPDVAGVIAGWLSAAGVGLRFGAGVERILHEHDRCILVAGGDYVRADLVVMGAGVAPRGELAVAAGIELDGGAVPVDATMSSTVAGLLAAGDVAKAQNVTAGRALRVEHWGDALGQGAIAGQTAAGIHAEWDAVPGFWSTIATHTLKHVAWGDGFEEVAFERHASGGFTARYGAGGSLVGVLTNDADADYERATDEIARGGVVGRVSPLCVVVVPARDEEERIPTCLAALAAQTVGVDAFEVILVADACRDATEPVARARAAELGLRLTVIAGPGEGTGPARRLGMDAAAERLESLGLPEGLIATTDADSEPAADWLERQLARVLDGARVIAGLVELNDEDGSALPPAVMARRRADAGRRMDGVLADDPDAAHHHFAGASLGITTDAYRAVGGLDPTPSLEDELFAQKLTEHGIRILRPADVVVATAARTHGRARHGLSVDLAVSAWRERRRYRAADFRGLDGSARTTSATVIIPTRECATTIAGVLGRTVEPALERGLVNRVVVVDAASSDGTAEVARAAGAEVIQQDDVLAELGPAAGKGDAMWRAVGATDGDIVCFLDGDTADPVPDHLVGLLGPLLAHPELQLVKGAFERPFRRDDSLMPHEGGRVTELMARPLLNLHFPLLAGFAQPLAGEFAARRSLLERLSFPVGYGVEIAVLIDALALCGLDALGECQLGTRQNRHQPLRALSEMSFAVLAAVERRLDGARDVTAGQYLRPWEDGAYVRVPVAERPPLRRPDAAQCACSVWESRSAASSAS